MLEYNSKFKKELESIAREVLRIIIILLLGSISNNNVFPLDAFYE